MCGIFGFVSPQIHTTESPKRVLDGMFRLSETRGREAAGIALFGNGKVQVLKEARAASDFTQSDIYTRTLVHFSDAPLAAIGHSRLVTNGSMEENENNQPVVTDRTVGIHNGIVVNVDELWNAHSDLHRTSNVDTELIFRLIDKFCRNGSPLPEALGKAFSLLQGAASVAGFLQTHPYLFLASNTGSLYWAQHSENQNFYFASERYILETLFQSVLKKKEGESPMVHQLEAGEACLVHTENGKLHRFKIGSHPQFHMDDQPPAEIEVVTPSSQATQGQRGPVSFLSGGSVGEYNDSCPDLYGEGRLKRCSRCLLPETFPFIQFNSNGVCNLCVSWKPQKKAGKAELLAFVEKNKTQGTDADVIMPFSGGRDSCYGLHLLKEMGIKPLAYTYDWGMVTDIARRNMARMTGKLGVEHILVSADIAKKRKFIRQNLIAWLKRPSLGMIPLLMAGDKQFYYYANELIKKTGIQGVLYGAGNIYEKTYFKTGFCGVDEGFTDGTLKLSLLNQIRLLSYYGYQYLRNSAYLNSSIPDTLFAFYSSYMAPKNAAYLFHFLDWDEPTIMKLLKEEYDWESAPDTTSSWRIGDGTSAFYNYVYYRVAGFSENDTFRSNQIREGALSREEGLRLVQSENRPRWDAIKTYLNLVGVDYDECMNRVNEIIPHYTQHQ